MSERQPTKPVGQPSSKPAKHPTDVRIRSVKFNVLMNMIVTTSSVIFPLITVPYVSRVLSTGGTGHVAFAQSVASYFSLVALLGVTYYGVRVCARVRDWNCWLFWHAPPPWCSRSTWRACSPYRK